MKSYRNPYGTSANFKNASVLLIEDNDDHFVLIKQAMKQCLSEVTLVRAATAAQALDLLETWQSQEWDLPKLILMDLYLPEQADGWQLLTAIQALPVHVSKIPIVMLSASASSSDIAQAYQRGISSYVVKSLDFEGWLTQFQGLRAYWWETATLPTVQYGF